MATQLGTFVNALQNDAAAVLAASIQHSSGTRFFVFNPLGHTRTDVADIATSLPAPLRVVDVTSGLEVRSQLIMKGGQQFLRILAENVPSVGYRVYEIQQSASQFADSAATFSNGNATLENDKYRVTVDGRGAITSLVDKRDANRELVQNIDGRLMNDIGSGSGSLEPENAGAVSASIYVNSSGFPAHKTRVTLYRSIDRVDIENEVTQNFGSTEQTYSFGFNISGYTVRHEEVGAVATAKLLNQGGSYSNDQSKYDFLTMNHFVDLSDLQRGVTLSNWDSPFFKLGNSAGASIDVATPKVMAVIGMRQDGNGFADQNGDSYFKNRFGLQRHGTYDQAAAMRMALEHQNPLVAAYLTGGSGPFPGTSYSMYSISDPDVMLWALKPAEEGISSGTIARLWNLSETAQGFSLLFNGTISDARKTTHIETNTGTASFTSTSLFDDLPSQRMQTYRLAGTPSFQQNQTTVRVALKVFLEG
ncbi:MAG: glycoside hydrolase, partial [Bacteroidota bacterium]